MEKTSLEEILKMLRPRLGFLDGVSISGGEPLLHRDLIDFLKELRFQGSQIRLKTNASRPRVIKLLIDKGLVDYFSVFIPAPFSKYKEVTNYNIDINEVASAIQMIRKSSIAHEFRVKPVPGLIEKSELMELANYLVGAPRFIIERFDPKKSMDKKYQAIEGFSEDVLFDMRNSVAPYFSTVIVES